MSKGIERFALDPYACLGQMDWKLILVLWVRDGRQILCWPHDFHDLSDVSNPVDTSGQVRRKRSDMLHPQTSLWLSFGLLASDTVTHAIKRSLSLTTAYNHEYSILHFKKYNIVYLNAASFPFIYFLRSTRMRCDKHY